MDYDDEHQKHLSLRFDTKRFWPDFRRELKVDQTGAAIIVDIQTTHTKRRPFIHQGTALAIFERIDDTVKRVASNRSSTEKLSTGKQPFRF